jgi:hypothetical protein
MENPCYNAFGGIGRDCAMSKKSERQKEKRKKDIRDACIVGVFALFFLILGIIGFVSSRSKYDEYSKSDDVRKVEATITYAEIHSRKDDYGTKKDYWKADIEFTVDGEEFKDKCEFSSEVKKGDTRKVEVYRAKDGTYKVPEITSDTGMKLESILYIGAAVFGLILGIICVVVALPDKSKK